MKGKGFIETNINDEFCMCQFAKSERKKPFANLQKVAEKKLAIICKVHQKDIFLY